MSNQVDLETIYERRFSPDLVFRMEMWKILCQEFFQQYIPSDSKVLEIAAGYCEFINNIQAGTKTAVDLNTATQNYANPDVLVLTGSSTDLSSVASSSQDIAFTSNFLEHLTREDIVLTLQEAYRVLKPQGRFLVLQPNIRFCARDYWMFFDHVTPLDDRAVTEALEAIGFKIVKNVVRFLPFTTKSRLPNSLFLLKLYLKLPVLWRIFGQQSFIVAQKATN